MTYVVSIRVCYIVTYGTGALHVSYTVPTEHTYRIWRLAMVVKTMPYVKLPTLFCGGVQYSTVQYSIVQYSIVQ